MEGKGRKLISEGNSYYELDLDCLERKKNQKEMERKQKKKIPPKKKGER